MIEIKNLSHRYRQSVALANVTLDVPAGQVVAILGPNGAGKTTLVEILEGFRRRTSGDVRVLGVDPGSSRSTRDRAFARGPERTPSQPFASLRAKGWHDRIGVLLQTTSVEPQLSVREALRLYHGLYPRPRPVAELLALLDLEDVADRRAGTLSGGQQRRLDLALALVGRPELLFLDEPTTGFDPAARRVAWNVIRALDSTVVLTTHYLEEAAQLADRIVVIADGRIVADGDPATLGDEDTYLALTNPGANCA